LIGRALSGNPPADIADELRDLLLSAVYSRAIGDLRMRGAIDAVTFESIEGFGLIGRRF
jgi:hypothetical protein